MKCRGITSEKGLNIFIEAKLFSTTDMHSSVIMMFFFLLWIECLEGMKEKKCFQLKYNAGEVTYIWPTRMKNIALNIRCSIGIVQLHTLTFTIPVLFEDFCDMDTSENKNFPACCQVDMRRNSNKSFCEASILVRRNHICNGQKACHLPVNITDMSDDCENKTDYCHVNATDRMNRCKSRWVEVEYTCNTGIYNTALQIE